MRLLGFGSLFLGFVVGNDDLGDQGMPYDVAIAEVEESDPFDSFENPARVALRFKPELLLTLSYANLAVAGLASFLMAGATVRFFLYRTRQDRVGAQS